MQQVHNPRTALPRVFYTFMIFLSWPKLTSTEGAGEKRERETAGSCLRSPTCSRTVPPGIVSCKQYFGAFSQDSG